MKTEFFSKDIVRIAEFNSGADRRDLDSCSAGYFNNRLTDFRPAVYWSSTHGGVTPKRRFLRP
ncbi:MAG TPA: hypothetical protein DCO70_09940 [Verrucomicrobiales bacterium]|nr:hypothetical protein [Verrucomicrobiales bacterium]